MEVLTVISIAAAVVVGLITLIFAFVKWRFGYWRRLGVPYVEPSFPFGNVNEAFMGKNHMGYVMQDLYKNFEGKPFGGIYLGLQPAVLLREPEIVRDVMVKNFGIHFQHRTANAHEKLDPLLFRNLFMLRGSKWRSLRNHMSPTFTSGKMKTMFQLVQEKANVLLQQIETSQKKGSMLDMKDMLALYTTDVISSCAFGIETNSLKNPHNEFREMGRKIFPQDFKHSFNTLIIFLYPQFVKVTRSVFIKSEVSNFFRKVVWEVVEEREKKNIKRGDFLDLLIELKNTGRIKETDSDDKPNSSEPKKQINADLKNFDGDDFVAQVVLFFGAGFETSSTTGSFALFELAANPEVQDRAIKEVDTILAEAEGEINYETVQQMRYLDMVINETLRKYPPLAVLDRSCIKEYRNEKYNLVVPEGISVMVPLFGFHWDPKYFPNPENFDPERFSEDNVKKIPNYCYMPFGEGPRNCIGMRFGLLQSKVALVNILSRFRVALTDEYKGVKSLKIDPKSFVLGVAGGIPLVVTRRTSNASSNG